MLTTTKIVSMINGNSTDAVYESGSDLPFEFRHVLQQVKNCLVKKEHYKRKSKLERKSRSKIQKNMIVQTMNLKRIGANNKFGPIF